MRMTRWAAATAATVAIIVAALGLATETVADVPRLWQMNLQAPATPTAERITELHDLLLVIISLISAFVLALLIYVMVRFRESANPRPSRTSHNTMLEVLWTAIPVIILVIIAIPSFKLLYYSDRTAEADMTVKVTGLQWYWNYAYPDHGDFAFDSYMIPEEDLKPGQLRLLEVDNRLVVPVESNIRLLVAGQDVMHSFFLPSAGVQIYSVPGRVNETWMRIGKEGVYRGQCNQICGINHSYMPIVVEAVSKPAFEAWVKEAKEKFAARDEAPAVKLAASAAK